MQVLQTMQEDLLATRRMVEDLIHVLAPVFPSKRVALSSSDEIVQALSQGKLIYEYIVSLDWNMFINYYITARNEAIANVANPNIRSKRCIDKVVDEARDIFALKVNKTNVTPPPSIRLKSLLRLLNRRKDLQSELTDEDVDALYDDLKKTTRDVMDDMIKDLKKKEIYVAGMSFSDIGKADTSIQESYCLILEKEAWDRHQVELYLCREMWAAKLLITEALRNRNKALNKKKSSSSVSFASSFGTSLSASSFGASLSASSLTQNNLNYDEVEDESQGNDSEFRYGISKVYTVYSFIFLLTFCI
jgi:hypothetical protein